MFCNIYRARNLYDLVNNFCLEVISSNIEICSDGFFDGVLLGKKRCAEILESTATMSWKGNPYSVLNAAFRVRSSSISSDAERIFWKTGSREALIPVIHWSSHGIRSLYTRNTKVRIGVLQFISSLLYMKKKRAVFLFKMLREVFFPRMLSKMHHSETQ